LIVSYFYFHKPGVSYEKAFADLDQCRQYGQASQIALLVPTFVPMGNALVKGPMIPTDVYPGPGLLVLYMMQETQEDNERATMRRCMAYKNYGRYGISRAIWKQIDTGTDAEKLARQALIASGPLAVEAVGIYLLTYVVTTLAAFGVVDKKETAIGCLY